MKMAVAKLEYIWLDGYKPIQSLRSKTKIERDFSGQLEDCPMWSFDGSSTEQAPGGSSDCLLKPLRWLRTAYRAVTYVAGLALFLPFQAEPTPGRGYVVTSKRCNDRVSGGGNSAAARSGSRRNAFPRAWTTLFMLHPSSRAQSQLEWRSRINITKTKRCSGASLVTASMSRSGETH